ncbi:hypothetical protein N864_03665 [Intrasporangium chromatireducens Q5-1]|uniref:Uncharacterized protein n=2 Tax=Intrasporangium TaxID=53357 RepID=W9GHC0_9MICO|nr:hypothetical protein N864_03665 [Intrasporangium chromatireducens Q5-1]
MAAANEHLPFTHSDTAPAATVQCPTGHTGTATRTTAVTRLPQLAPAHAQATHRTHDDQPPTAVQGHTVTIRPQATASHHPTVSSAPHEHGTVHRPDATQQPRTTPAQATTTGDHHGEHAEHGQDCG